MRKQRSQFVSRAMGSAARLFPLLVLAFAVLAAMPTKAAAQSGAPSAFPPLERWKAAVLAGDKTALKKFYSSAPEAFAQSPAGKSMDPANEEAQFWGGQHPLGLVALEPKILENTSPRPGVMSLVLRIEMTFRAQGETRQWMVSAAQMWVNPAMASGAGQNSAPGSGSGPGKGPSGMSGNDDWVIFATQRSDVVPLPNIRLPQPSVPNTHLYPEPGEASKELAEALAAAKQDHKRVLVVFGANWCYDCHVLDAALRSRELSPLVGANYHVIHINIGEGKDNADLADRFQVPLNKGIPSLAVLDGDGKLITSQKNGEFESAAKIGMEDVSGFLKTWKPPASK
jgi:thioredoxin 1